MSHNPYHPPEVMTLESGSLQLVLPLHLRRSNSKGGAKTFRDRDEYARIQHIRVENESGVVFTLSPEENEKSEVEVTYTLGNRASDSPAEARITIAGNPANGESVVVTLPKHLRRKFIIWHLFFKTFLEKGEDVRIKSVEVKSSKPGQPFRFEPDGYCEIQVMYYRQGWVERVAKQISSIFKPSQGEKHHNGSPQKKAA